MATFLYVQKCYAELQQNLLTTDYPSHIAVFLRRLMLGFLPNKPWTIITFTWRALYFARVTDFVLLVTNAWHLHLHLTKSQPHQLVLIKSQPHHLNPNKSQPRQLNLAFFYRQEILCCWLQISSVIHLDFVHSPEKAKRPTPLLAVPTQSSPA